MSDVLSPDEVDALLEGVSNGKLGKDGSANLALEATPYDLTATDHIERSDIPSMDLLNQGLARNLKKSFRSLLNDGTEVNVGDVTEEKFAEYILTLPEPTMLYLINIPMMHSQALFVISADLIQKYVDIYFGGGTKALEPTPREGFTSAETRVANQILEFALRDFVAAWEPIVSIQVSVVKTEYSPQFCKFMESAASVVISKFSVQLDEANEGWLSCVLPSSMLAPLYEKMDATNRGSQSEHRIAWTSSLKEQIQNVELTLASPIAKTSYSLGKLVRLQPGDIIPIELNDQVALKAGDVDLFLGKFGISRGKNAIRLEDVV